MANRIVANCYIIDSAGNAAVVMPWPGTHIRVKAVHFWSTNTTGQLWLVYSNGLGTTTSTAIRIQNNQNQSFTLPYYLGGVNFQQLIPITVTAGTGFLYLE